MKTIHIPTLTTTFSLRLRPHQISQWRGAVAEAAGWEEDLFHNHDNTQVQPVPQMVPVGVGTAAQSQVIPVQLKDRYLYRYPLIQYRVIKGKATIFSVGPGTTALRKWLLTKSHEIDMARGKHTLLIEGMKEEVHLLQMLPHPKGYRLMDYQPLNQENYEKWRRAQDLTKRIELLEGILVGNILKFASAMDYQLPERLEVKLMAIRSMRPVRVHGTERLGFNLVYKANIDLPPGIALGRAVSHGFGVQMPTRSQF